MTEMHNLPKIFYSIADLAKKWECTPDEVLHQVGIEKLKASAKIYGDYTASLIIGKEDEPSDQDCQNMLSDQPVEDEDGLYELAHEYIPHLIKDNKVFIDYAYCDNGMKAISIPLGYLVQLDDLVIKAVEVKRFETEVTQFMLAENPLSENEHNKLLKIIGALAMMLANSQSKYKSGENPNKSQIYKDFIQMMDDIEHNKNNKINHDFFEKAGLGSTTVKTTISKGISLLIKK